MHFTAKTEDFADRAGMVRNATALELRLSVTPAQNVNISLLFPTRKNRVTRTIYDFVNFQNTQNLERRVSAPHERFRTKFCEISSKNNELKLINILSLENLFENGQT